MPHAYTGRLSAVLAAAVLVLTTGGAEAQDWKKEWDKLVEGAKKEGVVFVYGPPGPFQREAVVTGWEKAFPGIKIEYTAARGTQILPKVVRERESGVFNWDIGLSSTDPTVYMLTPMNALAPLREAVIDPDVLDDSKWHGGFNEGFVDKADKFLYSPIGFANQTLGYANRDCVSTQAFNKADDLLKPEFKGKISTFDPLAPGIGSRNLWRLSVDKGMDFLKTLFTQQGITVSKDYRQMTDWLISCRFPVALGIPEDPMQQMRKQGLLKNAEDMTGTAYFGDHGNGWTGGNENIGIFNNAPHPNAAKLFVNWYLSRDGQAIYAKLHGTNSRRKDVPPGDPNPNSRLDPNLKYVAWGDEASIDELKKMQDEIEKWGVVK
jgi:iron(III) transport system substrate-binding protein